MQPIYSVGIIDDEAELVETPRALRFCRRRDILLKATQIEVSGFTAAMRGMRNPKNSWGNSDSYEEDGLYLMGERDLGLCQSLVLAGSEHRKFLRMITVTMDISAPLYWWKEFDTYKVGTACNSCSTMHKIHAKPFTREDFACEHLEPLSIIDGNDISEDYDFTAALDQMIYYLNCARKMFVETKDKRYWWQMIQLLPSSYIQKRTVQLNYEVARRIYFQRRNHKLDEWHQLCDILAELPYAGELITYEEEQE